MPVDGIGEVDVLGLMLSGAIGSKSEPLLLALGQPDLLIYVSAWHLIHS
jgi:hypothetical protein